jgi:phage-related protein
MYFRQPSGREPVREFLDRIDSKKELAQVLADLTLLRDEGPILPFPHSSSLVSFPGLRELRTRHGNSQFRIVYCVDKGDVILLHAFAKRATSQTRREFELAAERARRLK